jgi:hypothetical protein
MPLVGLETVDANSSSNAELRHPPIQGAAKSGALNANLRLVIEAWPRLPEAVRREIMALAKPALRTA